ncbi:MAG: hypothetical protein JWP01_3377 [Myxococcales bacterium]|nr:hypothetical protein [Myxococcales bacterium]
MTKAPIVAVLPHGCPPADAADVDAAVFYIVKENPCAAQDFKSQAERGLAKDGDPCCRCGISVWLDEEHARYKARQYQRLGKLIARAQLTPPHGKLKQTFAPPHHTWWPSDGVERHSLFEVVAAV